MNNVFIHKLADVQASEIGEGTKVWQFAVVLRGARIGRNCNVCANTFIENDVVVGDGVTIKCGVQLWDGMRVGNNVCIGPNVTFANDRHPRSLRGDDRRWKNEPVMVEDDVSIGANATILPGVTLGKGCLIGAGAVVTKNVPPHEIVIGNPAVIMQKYRGGGEIV